MLYNDKEYNFVRCESDLNQVLYKYMGNVNFIIDAIKTDLIYMSSPKHFNDPFDCSIKFDKDNVISVVGKNKDFFYYFKRVLNPNQIFFIESELCNENYSTLKEYILTVESKLSKSDYPLTYDNLLSRLCSKFNIGKNIVQDNNLKVTCFSDTNLSIPMWGYYANSHQGACLCYDYKLLNNEDYFERSILRSFCKVEYSEEFNLCDIHNPGINFQKSIQWKHEREWRVVCETDESFLYFPCLKSIYLGANMSYSDKLAVIKAADTAGIDIYLSKPNINDFKLDFIDFREYRKSY